MSFNNSNSRHRVCDCSFCSGFGIFQHFTCKCASCVKKESDEREREEREEREEQTREERDEQTREEEMREMRRKMRRKMRRRKTETRKERIERRKREDIEYVDGYRNEDGSLYSDRQYEDLMTREMEARYDS